MCVCVCVCVSVYLWQHFKVEVVPSAILPSALSACPIDGSVPHSTSFSLCSCCCCCHCVQGQIEFSSILFSPRRAPFDLFSSGAEKKKQTNLRLYVRRVFVTDECTDACPEWLSFVKGLVDSEDLPLNISREALQVSRILTVIRRHVVRKAMEMFAELADDSERYRTFYEAFAKNIKLGIHEDSSNRAKLAELLRFYSNRSGEQWTTLIEYVSRVKEGQQHMYYITGETREQCAHSPFLEGLQERGYEVLFFTDPLDEASRTAARTACQYSATAPHTTRANSADCLSCA